MGYWPDLMERVKSSDTNNAPIGLPKEQGWPELRMYSTEDRGRIGKTDKAHYALYSMKDLQRPVAHVQPLYVFQGQSNQKTNISVTMDCMHGGGP